MVLLLALLTATLMGMFMVKYMELWMEILKVINKPNSWKNSLNIEEILTGSVVRENIIGRVNGTISDLRISSPINITPSISGVTPLNLTLFNTGGVEDEGGYLDTSGCTICLDTIREVSSLNGSNSFIFVSLVFSFINKIKNKKTQFMASVCGHFFCRTCFYQMFKSQNNDYPCPMCRKVLKQSDIHVLHI